MPETISCAKCGGPVNPSDPLTVHSDYTGRYFCPGCGLQLPGGQVEQPASSQDAAEMLRHNTIEMAIESIRYPELVSVISKDVKATAAGQQVQLHDKPACRSLKFNKRNTCSYRVFCKDCNKDICEPTDKRTAKRFRNEHKENQHHDAVLVQEGWKW